MRSIDFLLFHFVRPIVVQKLNILGQTHPRELGLVVFYIGEPGRPYMSVLRENQIKICLCLLSKDAHKPIIPSGLLEENLVE